jgi:hypothetical protein
MRGWLRDSWRMGRAGSEEGIGHGDTETRRNRAGEDEFGIGDCGVREDGAAD